MNQGSSIKLSVAEKQVNNTKSYDLWIFIIATALSILLWFLGIIQEGLKLISNDFSALLVKTFGRNFPIFEVENQGSSLSIAFAVVVIVLWLAVIVFHILYKRNAVLSFTIGLVCLMTGTILIDGQFLLAIGFAFLILGIWAKEKVSAKRLALTLCFVAVFAVSSTYVISNGNVDFVDQIRFGKGAMNQGNILEAGKFNKDSDTKLVVKMNKPQSMYLRGYVGEVYNQGKWEELGGNRKAKYTNQFLWLHNQGYYGYNQLAKAATVADRHKTKNENTITVDNIDESSKYCFVPYEYLGNDYLDDKMAIGDAYLLTQGIRGNRQYSYTAVENVVKRYPQIIQTLKSEKNEDLAEEQAVVNAFVYKEYLNLTRNEKEILETALGSYTTEPKKKHFDYGKAKGKIIDYLSKHIKYTEETQNYSENFLEEFMQVRCKGYSIHFATAATMMFRYYGIPARYVEGYIITPEEKAQSVTLTSANAHAWVEYYQDGIGWIPYEVTTPYIGKMEQAKEIKSLPNTKEEIEKEKPKKKKNKDDTIQRNKEDTSQAESIWWISLVIVLLIIGAGYSFIRKRIINKRLDYIFNNESNIIIIRLHQYYHHVATKFNVENIKKESEELEYNLYQEARYSDHVMTNEQVEIVKDNVSQWLLNIYGDLNLWKKCLWKYILFISVLEMKNDKVKK